MAAIGPPLAFAENYAASPDTKSVSSELYPVEALTQLTALFPPGTPRMPTPTPINLDPPDHTKFRAPLNAMFSPKAILARKEEVRALAAGLIDKVLDQGHCDFIPAIAEPLPVQVFLKMMGLPLERQAKIRQLVHEFLAASDNRMDIVGRMRNVVDQ